MGNKLFCKTKLVFSLFLFAVIVILSVFKTEYISSAIAMAAGKPTISKKSQYILIGEKFDLNIKNKIKNSTYKWKSSDKKVATVNSKGVVTAKSKGTATITCTITTPGKEVIKQTCKVTVIEPALKIRISNKISKMNVGQEYDLNRKLTPGSSNDKTTWISSDETIAKPNSSGVFRALKEGTVTITAKTLSGASDSVTITVVDKDGIVKNQKELDSLLGSGVSIITIKTDEELKLTIKSGYYLNQKLVIDAPNAEIENYGKFKSVDIKRIKNISNLENYSTETENSEIYTFNKPLSEIKSITVKYSGIGIELDSILVKRFIEYLEAKEDSVKKWEDTENRKENYNSLDVEIKGTKGSLTKEVSIKGGLLGERSYKVTVNSSNNSITVEAQNQTYTIYKLDDRSIKISPEPSFDLKFIAK